MLCRKIFINISESKADRQKVKREMLFRMTTLTTYMKVIEIGEGPVHRQLYRAILLHTKWIVRYTAYVLNYMCPKSHVS